jgi:folate-dependent phosphoribosylglycinamide formyltransferase PurN
MSSTKQPLRVAVLCSQRAPALRHLLEHESNRGRLYDVVACLTTEESFAEGDLVRARDIPLLTHSLRRFCSSNGWNLADHTARITFDGVTRRRLSAYDVDIVVLDAYLYVLSAPMLTAYRGRIINVHHSDLLVRDAAGLPRFAGLQAVRDAILAGLDETRATTHLVTAGLDQGPPLVRSWAFPVAALVHHALAWGAMDILKAYAYAHQEWMIRATWGPLVDATLSMVADGRLDLAAISDTLGNRAARPFDLDEDGRIGASSADDTASATLMAMVG